MRVLTPFTVGAAMTLVSAPAFAQLPEPPPEPTPAPALDVHAWVESFYTHSFEEPSNGIVHLRGFDNRHNTISLANAVLDANLLHPTAIAHVTLQAGTAPQTYYLAEPTKTGAAGTAPSDAAAWRVLQQAFAGFKLDDKTAVEAGLFLSPVGYEGLAVKDNVNFSRSNLFFGLPFYHSGARVRRELPHGLVAHAMVCNGWNSIVDGNEDLSVEGQVIWTASRASASLLYFGGNERPVGSPEGRPWRHLADFWGSYDVLPWLTVATQLDGGTEENRIGTHQWYAGAAYLVVKPKSWLRFAARGDVFHEQVAEDGDTGATSSAIFWPVERVGSVTLTADIRPNDNSSVRLEYRMDSASDDAFFSGDEIEGDGVATPYVPNTDSQSTVTLGLVAWF